MRKLLSKIFNQYTIGLCALFSSAEALAADGSSGATWPLLLIGGAALGGIIWAVSDSSDDNDEIFS